MEALLRWCHPTVGVVMPSEFLRLAENSGKIIEIGEWVLRAVCKQYHAWKKVDFQLQQVAVNISLRQFENPHFIYRLSQILDETEMRPEWLVLEISEGQFHKLELFKKTIQMLKKMGVEIAIDNFGTGNLSLQNLLHIPMDYLSIDSSLVRDLAETPESLAIIKMIVELASSLHLSVVAEGVETLEQKELLESVGCDLMQGYFFSLPGEAKEFTPEAEKVLKMSF
jgi:EAL domain-containing protein (putative c-di-GMP-specific phosphodiesterase class I)